MSKEELIELADSSIKDPETRKVVDGTANGAFGIEQAAALERSLTFGGQGLLNVRGVMDEKRVAPFLEKYDLTEDAQRYEEIISINPNDYDLTEDAEKFMDRFNIAVKTASYQELKLIGRLDIIEKVKADRYFEKDITLIETKLNESTQQNPQKNIPMKQKNRQEQHAANRQVELLTNALNGAAVSGGYWLNASSRSEPRFYPKGPTVSAFNSLILGMHADQNGYKTNLYTTFMDAKKRGEAIKSQEKGAPFLWYHWKEYVNRHNPEDILSRMDYQKLSKEDKALYKGVRDREVMTLFNIDQTTAPMVNKEQYEQVAERYGRYEDRLHTKGEENKLRMEVNNFMLQIKDHLVPIRKDTMGIARYDSEKNAVYLPEQKHYEQYNDYVQEMLRQVVTATGHQQRLAREGMVMKGGTAPSEDALKYERLIAELTSGAKMMEMGLPARLSAESMPMTEYWMRELKENPCLIDAIESDVNNSMDIIRKAEEGEKIEFASLLNQQQTKEMRERQKPQVDSRENAILLDIIRHGGMKIDERNFSSPEERKDFLEKFSLSYYEKEMSYALEQAKNGDPEVAEAAFTTALNHAARIAEVCTEVMSDPWNRKGTYAIADELKDVPDKSSKEMVIVKDGKTGVADVVMPAGAMGGGVVIMPSGEKRPYSLTPDEVMTAGERAAAKAQVKTFNMPGFSKQRIQNALQKEGVQYTRFYNNSGQLGYRPDDSYFEGKEVTANKLDGKELKALTRYDVDNLVQRATQVPFERIQMLRDDEKRWAIYLKPQNEPSFSIYPDKADINQFFSTIKQGQNEEADKIRKELAQKYYALATNHPELKIDLFGNKDESIDLSRIRRVNIFKSKDERILCCPVIDGIQKLEPREITPLQWQRLWVAEDMAGYKTDLAGKLFSDLLQKNEAVHVEEKVTDNRPVNMEQYEKLKSKHPDAIFLFRTGENYESYADDAKILGKVLKIETTTGTDGRTGSPIEISSFDANQLDTCLPKLIREGNRVAICEQLEPIKALRQEQRDLQQEKAAESKEAIDREEEVQTGRHL